MTPREELIALDRDSLEQQVIHLEQKLESAQFERGQERSRAEKAEAACAYYVDLIQGWIRDVVDDPHEPIIRDDVGKGWLSPDQKRETIEALESIAEHHAETECWRDIANKMLSKLKESQ